MTNVEQQVYNFLKRNLGWLCVVLITMIRLEICFYLRRFESGDFQHDLLGWFEEIQANGGMNAMKQQVGNYNITYQLIIGCMTYLPVKPLYMYKGLSILFDFVLAISCGVFVCKLRKSRSWMLFSGVYAAVLLLPVTYLNSSAWAQCDSIYASFVIIALYFLYDKKYIPSFLMMGVALAFKLQMIFIFPFLIFYYFLEKKYSILHMGLIIVGWYVLSLPGILMRGNWLEPFKIYFSQTDTHKAMWLNFPSFWMLIGDNYDMLKKVAILVTILILGLALAYSIYRNRKVDLSEDFLQISIWTTWTSILFLPAMHERYSYLVDILLLLLVFINMRFWIIAAIEIISSMLRYQAYLFGGVEVSTIHAIVYLAAWLCFTWMVFIYNVKEKDKNEHDKNMISQQSK